MNCENIRQNLFVFVNNNNNGLVVIKDLFVNINHKKNRFLFLDHLNKISNDMQGCRCSEHDMKKKNTTPMNLIVENRKKERKENEKEKVWMLTKHFECKSIH